MNARDFFINSCTVWTSENFQNILLGNYEFVENGGGGLSLASTDLQKAAADKRVEECVFEDADAFLESLALLIQKQIGGEEGELLTDSSANYFFVRARDGNLFSVLVRWESAQGLWRCGAYLQEELKMPNIRIFYPE